MTFIRLTLNTGQVIVVNPAAVAYVYPHSADAYSTIVQLIDSESCLFVKENFEEVVGKLEIAAL